MGLGTRSLSQVNMDRLTVCYLLRRIVGGGREQTDLLNPTRAKRIRGATDSHDPARFTESRAGIV